MTSGGVTVTELFQTKQGPDEGVGNTGGGGGLASQSQGVWGVCTCLCACVCADTEGPSQGPFPPSRRTQGSDNPLEPLTLGPGV